MVPALSISLNVLFGAASKLSRSALLAFPEEAVKHVARIKVGSGDRACVVDRFREYERSLAGPCARTGRVECGNSSVLSAHEAMINIARVRVGSRDRPLRVDAQRRGALEGTCARCRKGRTPMWPG